LGRVLDILNRVGVNIEYMYAFVGRSCDDAVVVFRVEEIDRAIELLSQSGVKLLGAKEVYTF
jgi:hypothetical protein